MLIAALALTWAAMAWADVALSLDSFEFDAQAGLWEYTYEVDNSAGTEYVYYFELNPVDQATITGNPTGWDDTYQDTSLGGYTAWNAPDTGDWISPGGTLSGFVIESPYGPVNDYVEWFLVTDADGSEGGTTGSYEGYVGGPHIPEPATLLLVAAGAGLVLLRRGRARGA